MAYHPIVIVRKVENHSSEEIGISSLLADYILLSAN